MADRPAARPAGQSASDRATAWAISAVAPCLLATTTRIRGGAAFTGRSHRRRRPPTATRFPASCRPLPCSRGCVGLRVGGDRTRQDAHADDAAAGGGECPQNAFPDLGGDLRESTGPAPVGTDLRVRPDEGA